jgi:hypothetical protein
MTVLAIPDMTRLGERLLASSTLLHGDSWEALTGSGNVAKLITVRSVVVAITVTKRRRWRRGVVLMYPSTCTISATTHFDDISSYVVWPVSNACCTLKLHWNLPNNDTTYKIPALNTKCKPIISSRITTFDILVDQPSKLAWDVTLVTSIQEMSGSNLGRDRDG